MLNDLPQVFSQLLVENPDYIRLPGLIRYMRSFAVFIEQMY